MRSFVDIISRASAMPAGLVTELARIDFGRGREELHRAQAPQVLDRLAARTRLESITASNAIEDVVLDPGRARALIADTTSVGRNRTEREFSGYRDAVDHLMAHPPDRLELGLILHLHRLLMRHLDDPLAGRFKESDNLIGAIGPDGAVRVIFRPVPAGDAVEWHMSELVARYEEAVRAGVVHPLVLVSALVLDLLAIHPFADGNGRVARLVTTAELMRHGYGIARYVSVEQRIYDSRNSYYEALRASQVNWHGGGHDLWPWAGYLLRVLGDAYGDFERRVVAGRAPAGVRKADRAREHILQRAPARFSFAELADALPDISAGTLRKVLAQLRAEGRVVAERGRGGRWTRLG